MTRMIALLLLLTTAMLGAVLEGLWPAMPTAWVQFNGLVLILSVLALLANLLRLGRSALKAD